MTRIYWIASVVVAVSALAVSAALYPKMPDRVPIHWNIRGEVDRYGSKEVGTFLLPSVTLGLLGLFAVLPFLTPKSMPIDTFRETYAYISLLVAVLMTYIHGLTLAAALGHPPDISRALVGGMYVFFALMGNVLGKVTRNPYVGIKVPWTLASDRVWNATHRLGAWMFVGCGIVGLLLVLVGAPLPVTLIPIAPTVVVPIVYSWLLSRKLKAEGLL